MSDTQIPLPSLADRVRSVIAGAPVVGVHFLGSTPVFVLGEEALLFAGEDGERRVVIHAGANFIVELPAGESAIDLNSGAITLGSMMNVVMLPGATVEFVTSTATA